MTFEAFHDTACQEWIAVQTAHGNAGSAPATGMFLCQRRRGWGLRLCKRSGGLFSPAERAQDGALVRRGWIETNQNVPGNGVGLNPADSGKTAQLFFEMALAATRPGG
jgi:hypothetical protein